MPGVTRRELLQAAGAIIVPAAAAYALQEPQARNPEVAYGKESLAPGIRSRFVNNNNGVRMHVLEAGFEDGTRPCVVFLHGFPEIGYTWRNQLLPLARAGFHAIAPDLRGIGRSTAVPVAYEDDLRPYCILNRVSDVLGLVRALGYRKVAAVVGHDWGGPVAAWCALTRPDVFQSVVLMSTPFDGPPTLPLDTASHPGAPAVDFDFDSIEKQLEALPHPRKHYRRYYATRAANEDMWHAPQGTHDLLRALFHFKSADWKGNKPFPLKSWAASELAKMPTYYIMDLHESVAATVAAHMPSSSQIGACRWMTEQDLDVYSGEYTRTGFQGGLNWYRIFGVSGELNSFSGRTIDVPSLYIAGGSEWGVYQSPGAFEAMQRHACTRLLGVHLVAGAGHSVAEEQPAAVNGLIIDFLGEARALT